MATAAVVAAVAAAGLAVTAVAAHAQGVRGSAVTNVRYLTLRPIQLDTVPLEGVVDVDGTTMFDGEEVFCAPGGGDCTRYLPADVAHAVVATQDISGTVWGLGLQGLSATFLVRGRSDLGGGFSWPRSDDPFDAILAYAELNREHFRVRAGRQRTLSGLGFAGYDGLDVVLTPAPWFRAEAYGGRSLARGLSEPRNDALRAIEDFILDQDAWIVGGLTEITPRTGTQVAFRYQREIWANRVGLVSERASADFRSQLPAGLRAHGSLDYDFGFDRIGKGHLTLQSRLPRGWGWVELTGRRYVPYFELSTIWGFFSPTEYHEAEVEATVLRFRPLTVWASAGVREYGDPEISVIGPSITDRTQRYGIGARWAGGPWRATGEYRLETGFGAFLSSGDLSLRFAPSPAWALTARAGAFQQIEQFRLGENAVVGGGLGAEIGLPFGSRLQTGADFYVQAFENRAPGADWDQLRAYSVLTIPFGEDPGMRGRR